jgi:signal transduction histidine kinase/ActR/RegA family two-component response regulator
MIAHEESRPLDTTPEFDLFEAEEAIITRGRRFLSRFEHSAPEAISSYQDLLTEYAKVCREYRRLVRISDRQQEQLYALNEDLRRISGELRAANEAKSVFLATLSHEIRTPLSGVLGMVRALLDTPLDSRQHDWAETIRYAGEAMLSLVNDTLDLSKIESGRLELERLPFDMRRLVDAIVMLMSARAREKGIGLTARVRPDVPTLVVGDPTRLRQILLNLVSNAIKFTEQGGVMVEVGVIGAEDGAVRLRIAVIDSGIGISTEAQSRIFDFFSQGDASIARRFGGSGLGLAICNRLVQAMGGVLSVESGAPAYGSTFHFTVALPIAAVPGRSPATALVVLVADDEPVSRKVTSLLLNHAGHRAVIAENGERAVAAVAEGGIDLVLMDMEMPVMDGFAAARNIRSLGDPALATVPIIALTGRSRADDTERYAAIGIDGVLGKPIDPDILDAFLDSTVARRHRPA